MFAFGAVIILYLSALNSKASCVAGANDYIKIIILNSDIYKILILIYRIANQLKSP